MTEDSAVLGLSPCSVGYWSGGACVDAAVIVVSLVVAVAGVAVEPGVTVDFVYWCTAAASESNSTIYGGKNPT